MAKKKPPKESDFEDAATLVRDEPDDALDIDIEVARDLVDGPLSEPPALPFELARRTDDDDAFLDALPKPAKALLESARRKKAPWPVSPRIPAAVATPVTKPKK